MWQYYIPKNEEGAGLSGDVPDSTDIIYYDYNGVNFARLQLPLHLVVTLSFNRKHKTYDIDSCWRCGKGKAFIRITSA